MGMDLRPGVLVVEDQPGDRREIADAVLRIKDARIRYADSVQKAVGLLRTDETMDVVVLDLGLAGSRGRETVAQWLACSSWHGPVVVATISDDENARLDCESQGWAFVRKDSEDYRQQLDGALRAAMSLEDSSASTASAKHRQALAESLNRMEKRQSEMAATLQTLVDSFEELKRQRLGYWSTDEKGRPVFVKGCFTVCQEYQELMESGKKLGTDAAGKLVVAIASAVGTGICGAIVWLVKEHLAR